MKILLTSTKSLLEYLYRKAKGEEVELTMNIAHADIIVNTDFVKNFYDKTLVLTSSRHSDLSDLAKLSKVNTIIARVPLDSGLGSDYLLEPYEPIKIPDLEFRSKINKPISDLSIKDFIITKYKDTYYMDSPSSYLGTKYKGNLTLVGLLKHQEEEITNKKAKK